MGWTFDALKLFSFHQYLDIKHVCEIEKHEQVEMKQGDNSHSFMGEKNHPHINKWLRVQTGTFHGCLGRYGQIA